VPEFKDVLTKDDYTLLKGTLSNRDILRQALGLIRASEQTGIPLDHARLGQLLTEHHANLRDAQRISTPKIDRMLDAALAVGALGGKINGSGGGGCMFAYAPGDATPGGADSDPLATARRVAEAIEREGGRAYIVSVDEGTVRHQLATSTAL
jgi:galactokinase